METVSGVGIKKMAQLLGISILIMLVTKVNTQLRKTRIVKSYFEKTVWSVTSNHSTSPSNINSKLQCAEACSFDNLCTRFEFCPNSLTDKCTLYQSARTCHEQNDEKTNMGCMCFKMEWMRNEDETCRCPVGYYGNGDQCCQHVIQDCSEGYDMFDTLKGRKNVIASIKPVFYPEEPFEVLCHFGSWDGFTIIQNRVQYYQSNDFNKNWIEYRNGFGTLHDNYWLGLDKMYQILQNNSPNGFHLYITLVDTDLSMCEWYLERFELNGESSNYTATVRNYEMTDTGNYWCDGMFTSLTPDSRPFSTYDHISYHNDFNCTGREESGWWFADDVDCSFSNMNSKRIDGEIGIKKAYGTIRAQEVFMQIIRA